jgi:tryptophanase
MAAATIAWPQKTREHRNAVMDSTRWDGFPFREGDIVIATWAKSGTTWTQQIVTEGLFHQIDAESRGFLKSQAAVQRITGLRRLQH